MNANEAFEQSKKGYAEMQKTAINEAWNTIKSAANKGRYQVTLSVKRIDQTTRDIIKAELIENGFSVHTRYTDEIEVDWSKPNLTDGPTVDLTGGNNVSKKE